MRVSVSSALLVLLTLNLGVNLSNGYPSLKTIKKELGVETDDKDALVKKFRNRIASIEGVATEEEESAEEKWKDGVIPAVARAAIEEELSKLEALEKNSAEFNVTRNYLDWLTGLPWGSVSGEVFDVAAAKEALDDVRGSVL